MLPDEVLQNRASAKEFLKEAFQPSIDAVNALSDMRRKAAATVPVNIRGRTVAYATLWEERQLFYHAPREWTGVWPGVLYNNNGGGSGGFEEEYAVTKSSCLIVMMDEDKKY